MEKVNLTSVKQLINHINEMPSKKRKKFVYSLEEVLKNLKLNETDSVDGFVFKTEDLEQFGTVEGNRLISEDSAYTRELASSLKKIGNVAPVIVNEKGETVDGQRRITAFKKYGLKNPLRYTRVVGANIDTVADLNRLQIKWNNKDWLHKYVAINKPDYIQYKDIGEKYEKYMRPRSLRSLLMNYRIEAFKADVWENGEFLIKQDTLQNAIEYLEFLAKVYLIGEKDNVFAKDRNFQKALFDIYKLGGLDESRMLRRIRRNFDRLNVKVEYNEYKKLLFEIYNLRLSPKKQILEPVEETEKEEALELEK